MLRRYISAMLGTGVLDMLRCFEGAGHALKRSTATRLAANGQQTPEGPLRLSTATCTAITNIY
eukprot:1150768-Pelagomonas_calceolata.AAC.5